MSENIRDYGWLLEMEGNAAYRSGILLDKCPYHPNSTAALAWADGWLKAFKSDYEKLEDRRS
jgi:hypothetical protein